MEADFTPGMTAPARIRIGEFHLIDAQDGRGIVQVSLAPNGPSLQVVRCLPVPCSGSGGVGVRIEHFE